MLPIPAIDLQGIPGRRNKVEKVESQRCHRVRRFSFRALYRVSRPFALVSNEIYFRKGKGSTDCRSAKNRTEECDKKRKKKLNAVIS